MVIVYVCMCAIGTKLALKYVSKNKTKLRSFLREYSLTAALGCSPFIIKALDVLFETEESYVFGQEYAPAGDLFDIIPPQVERITMINSLLFIYLFISRGTAVKQVSPCYRLRYSSWNCHKFPLSVCSCLCFVYIMPCDFILAPILSALRPCPVIGLFPKCVHLFCV